MNVPGPFPGLFSALPLFGVSSRSMRDDLEFLSGLGLISHGNSAASTIPLNHHQEQTGEEANTHSFS